jgi:hypothetical protein
MVRQGLRTGLLLRHQDGIQPLTLHVLLFRHVTELDDRPARSIIPNRRDTIFNICNSISHNYNRSCGPLTEVMTVFVHKALWFVLHCNAPLLQAIHWALLYRVRVSIGTTAVNRRMERIVVDLVVRESGNLLRYATLEVEQCSIWASPTSSIHVDTITLDRNVSAGWLRVKWH